MGKRKLGRIRIPDQTVTDVLLRSRRRCALCFGLDCDLSTKRVQIAHVNRDHQDFDVGNLAALCLPHHDDYDTKPRQTKSMEPAELSVYRDRLYDVLEKREQKFVAKFIEPDRSSSTVITSTRRLGEIAEAFDEDAGRGPSPNGIRIGHLGRRSLLEFGDFFACNQAVNSLLDLIELSEFEQVIQSCLTLIHPTKQTRASPATAMNELLRKIKEVDSSQYLSAVLRFSRRPLRQSSRGECAHARAGNSLFCVIAVLYSLIDMQSEIACGSIGLEVQSMAQVMMGSSVRYGAFGFDIPRETKRFFKKYGIPVAPGPGWANASGPITDWARGNWPPSDWFSSLYVVALLPPAIFGRLIETLPQATLDVGKTFQVGADPISFESATDYVDQIANNINGGYSSSINVATADDEQRIKAYAATSARRASVALVSLKSALQEAHNLVWIQPPAQGK